MNRCAHHLTMLVACCLFMSSCLTSVESGVEINPTAEQDDAYIQAYKAFTQEASIIADFEHRYSVTATVLTGELRSALAKRYERLYKVQQSVLEEASSKSGFFVTIFSPNRNGYDLDDEVQWTILLQLADSGRKPTVVRRIDDKERWSPFFPKVNQWSKEYLIIFDEALPDLSSPELVKKNSINLTFANADATVKLTW